MASFTKIFGNSLHNSLVGGGSRDEIYGFDGNDSLFGGDGQDSLFGDAGNDWLYGGDGADLLQGGYGNDALYGGVGGDVLDGGDGHDALFGGAGNDAVTASAGNDTVDGGAGTDAITFSGARDSFTLKMLDATTLQITGTAGVTVLRNVETFKFADVTYTAADLTGNLVAGALQLNTSQLLPNGTLNVAFNVQAAGALDVRAIASFEVLSVATGQISTVSVQDLANMHGGDAQTAVLNLPALGLGVGDYQIRAVLDATGTVLESNEADNATAWAGFSVIDPMVQIDFYTDISPQRSDFDKNGGGTLAVDINVFHSGTYGAGTHYVDLKLVHMGGADLNILQEISLGLVAIDVAANGQTVVSAEFEIPSDYDQGDWQLVSTFVKGFALPVGAVAFPIVEAALQFYGGAIYGDATSNILSGSFVDDAIFAMAGDDWISATLGNDVVYGGDGTDIMDYASSGYAAAISVSGMAGSDAVTVGFGGQAQQLHGMEMLIATEGDDEIVLINSTTGWIVEARGGNDVLLGSMGNDTVNGGEGDDFFDINFGDDLLILGGGADQISILRDITPGAVGFGVDTVVDFNVADDTINIGYDFAAESFASPFDFISDTDSGALIDLGNGTTVLLQDVLAADLQASNFTVFNHAPFASIG